MKANIEKDAIPDGWQRVRLGDVARLGSGKTPPYDNEAGTVPVLGSNGPIGLARESNFSNGLAVGRVGASGSIQHVREAVWLSDNVLFVDPKIETCNLSFLCNALQTADLPGLASKTAQPLITQSDLSAVKFLLPPLPEQRAIAAVLDSVDDAIEGAEAVIAAIEGLRDALLHDLLTRGLPGQHTEFRDVPGLGTIPADWDVVRLGDVAETITSGSRAWSRHFRTDGALFVRSQNIVKGRIDRSDPVFVEAPNDKEAERTRIREGDILVSITGEPGKATVADEYIGEAYVSQHVAMVRLREPQFSQYVCRSLQSSFGQEQFSRMAYGQTRLC